MHNNAWPGGRRGPACGHRTRSRLDDSPGAGEGEKGRPATTFSLRVPCHRRDRATLRESTRRVSHLQNYPYLRGSLNPALSQSHRRYSILAQPQKTRVRCRRHGRCQPRRRRPWSCGSCSPALCLLPFRGRRGSWTVLVPDCLAGTRDAPKASPADEMMYVADSEKPPSSP